MTTETHRTARSRPSDDACAAAMAEKLAGGSPIFVPARDRSDVEHYSLTRGLALLFARAEIELLPTQSGLWVRRVAR